MIPRILIANPNTSTHITDGMVQAARTLVDGRAEIVGATATFGAPALESAQDLRTAKDAVLEMLWGNRSCNGVLIAAFGDPGLALLRSSSRFPVEGLGEAGLLAAGADHRRFAILTLGPAMRASILTKVEGLGLDGQLSSLDFLDCSVLELARDPLAHRDAILRYTETAARQGGAEAMLLAGAPFSGLAGEIAAHAPIPVFDGLSAGVNRLLAALQR